MKLIEFISHNIYKMILNQINSILGTIQKSGFIMK